MRSSLRQLARSGMKGRKKDTRVLTAVIAMSFLFLTVGTLLLSSLTESQARQRHSLYGSWQFFCPVGDNAYLREPLEQQPWVEESHLVTVLGTDEKAGAVAVWDANFARLGGLQLVEGRAPEKAGEIVLEKGQLSLYDQDISLGSTVTISLQKEYSQLRGRVRPDNLPENLTILGIAVEAEPFWKLSYDITGEGLETWICDNWFKLRGESVGVMQGGTWSEEPIFPEEVRNNTDSPREMNESTRRTLVEAFAACFGEDYFWTSGLRLPVTMVGRNAWTYDVYNGIRWDLKTKYGISLYDSVNLSEDFVCQYGSVTGQSVALSQECTVVGILETTADRWDVGDAQAPNCYVHQASADLMLETARHLNRESGKKHLFTPAEKVLNDGGLLFLKGSDSIGAGYAALMETPVNVLHASTADTFSVNLHGKVDASQLPPGEADPVSQSDILCIRAALAEYGLMGATEDSVDYGYQSRYYQYYEVQYRPQASEGDVAVPVWFCRPVIAALLPDGNEVRCESDTLYAYSYGENGTIRCDTVALEELLSAAWAPDGYVSAGFCLDSMEEAYTYNNGYLRINRYGWPMEQGISQTMGTTVIGVIMVITVCAVFQIFFTQLRRRARKLTLLRSVGATNGQVFAILAWEGFYITLASLLIGDALGVGVSYLITTKLNDTVFYVDWALFVTGQLCGLIAVAAGMLLPSIRAIRAPLVGRMEGKKRRHVKVRAMKMQTWHRICARDRAGNPGRTLGTAALCVFLVTMELICVFLGNAAFDTYRQTIVAADHPDYTLEYNHAASERKRDELTAMVEEVPGVTRADFYRKGEHLFLWYDRMDESPVITALKAADGSFFETSRQENPPIAAAGLMTQIYALDTTTDLFKRLNGAVTEGSVSPDAFEEGEEVIVMMPMYCPGSGSGTKVGETMREVLESSGAMSLSFNANTADVWQKDSSIVVGDTITVGTDKVKLGDSGVIYIQQSRKVRVAAIVRYFPDQGVWPFSGDVQSHVIVGGRKLMASLYNDGFMTYDDSRLDNVDMYIQTFDPYGYGNAYFSLYADTEATIEQTLSPVTRIAREKHMTLRNYRDSNQAVYDKALSSCLLVGTLAFAATLIVWMILSNTLISTQEQGRKRTGILQSLGITAGQLVRSQAAQAVMYWAVSTVTANVLLLLVILLAGWIERFGQGLTAAQLLQMILREDFVGYPWLLHGALCLLELPMLLWFHLRAAKIPLKYSPVENIRS